MVSRARCAAFRPSTVAAAAAALLLWSSSGPGGVAAAFVVVRPGRTAGAGAVPRAGAAPTVGAGDGRPPRHHDRSATLVALTAKKKAKAALDALERLEQSAALLEEPLSKKELLEREKKQRKQEKAQQQKEAAKSPPPHEPELKQQHPHLEVASPPPVAEPPTDRPLSKAEKLLRMEQEALANEARFASANGDEDQSPTLSKKELKELKKKQEKEALRQERKAAKKAEAARANAAGAAANAAEAELDGAAIHGAANGAGVESLADAAPLVDDEKDLEYSDDDMTGEGESAPEGGLTLEDKVRRDRPPPRIRVMESAQPGYSSLRLENVGITFRNQAVLKDVTWGVQTGDRIGLVGANGAGKTTQLRILAGELEPTTGDVVKSSSDLRVAMLRQEFIDELEPGRTLKEELLSVFEEENKILTELKEAEAELGNSPPEDVDRMQAILDRMQELQNLAEDKEVYTLESRITKVMDLMGFNNDEGDDLVASFSGGWKMRIGLGKVLLKDPNILLLDEPTNHLDLESVEWLEAFLRQQNIPMIIVSHDREFLDQVCNKIVDAEGGICTEYDGNYSRFLELKQARMDSWNAAYAAQEKKIKEERQWISKFKDKQPQAVKQRIAKLEKFINSEEYVQKPPFTGKPFRFRFPDAPRLSPEVAEIEGLSHGYKNELTNNRLFDNVNLFIEKGDRIAIVGPNGSGKSTLLRLLVGKEAADAGRAGIVGQNVVLNYFEQNQADALDLDKTVIETIQGASNAQSYNELRALLGQFLFKGDAVEKKVRNLSGGEKARLSLCCMMLRPANFLILDEPTNHLDIPAKQMLEEALQNFAGSVMIVSHDRYFISRCANTIVAIEDKNLVKYQGDYKFYMDRSKQLKEKIESRYVKGASRIEAAPVVDIEQLEAPDKKKNFGGAKTANLVSRKDKGVKNAKRLQRH